MMFDLAGRVALVTGGNGGIGLGMARGLAAQGASIAIAGRNPAKNAEAAALLPGALVIEADLVEAGAPEAVLSAVRERFGQLDILVNNAGTNIRCRPEEVSDADWEAVLDINLGSMMRLTRAAHPMLKASGRGRVINVASIMAIFALPFSPAYCASKGAVVQYTKALAVAWAQDAITANAVLPGWIETELTDRARVHAPGLYERQAERTPMARWGRPEDLGGIAAFLASDGAAFVTGTAIPVDGGFAAMG